MGKYTLHTDPQVDAIVESHLSEIRECVLRYFQPEALLLSGSFGRGEGSISLDGGQVRFYSDYEVSLISSQPRARLAIEPIQRELNEKLPLSVSLFWTTPRKLHNNLSRNLSFGPPYPSIGLYELKAGGRIFYGEFDLSINRIEPAALPVCEGVRLIANRMMEGIEKWANFEDRTELAFSLSKLVLACGDALLLKSKRYHYSYAEREQRFIHEYPKLFEPVLDTDFLTLYQKAASFKLRPYAEVQPDEILDELPPIRAYCWQILHHLLELGDNNSDQIFHAIAACIPNTYRTGLTAALDVNYENLILWLRTRRAGKQLHFGNNRTKEQHLSVFQQLYGAIPSLFWGLPMDGQPDLHMLQISQKWGAWAFKSSDVSQQQLVSTLLSMWHAFG